MTGAVKANQSRDNVVTGLSGVVSYDITENQRIFAEIGGMRATGEGSSSLELFDTLTGQDFGTKTFNYTSAESMNYQTLGYEVKINDIPKIIKDITIRMSLNRVVVEDDVTGRETSTYGEIGANINVTDNLNIRASQAINAERTSVAVGFNMTDLIGTPFGAEWKLTGNYSRNYGRDQIGAGVTAKGETWEAGVGVQTNVIDPDVLEYRIQVVKRLGHGFALTGGFANGNPTLGLQKSVTIGGKKIDDPTKFRDEGLTENADKLADLLTQAGYNSEVLIRALIENGYVKRDQKVYGHVPEFSAAFKAQFPGFTETQFAEIRTILQTVSVYIPESLRALFEGVELYEEPRETRHTFTLVDARNNEIDFAKLYELGKVDVDSEGNIIIYGLRADSHTLGILRNPAFAGFAQFADGSISRGITEAQASVARRIDSIAKEYPELLKLYNIQYSALDGYYFYDYRGDKVVLGQGPTASRVILPSDLKQFSGIFQGIQSEFPIIYEENLPMMEKMETMLRGNGYMVLRGVGFVEMTEDIITRLYDVDATNGTTRNVVVGRKLNGDPLYSEEIAQLSVTVNGQRHEAAGSYFQLGVAGEEFYERAIKDYYVAPQKVADTAQMEEFYRRLERLSVADRNAFAASIVSHLQGYGDLYVKLDQLRAMSTGANNEYRDFINRVTQIIQTNKDGDTIRRFFPGRVFEDSELALLDDSNENLFYIFKLEGGRKGHVVAVAYDLGKYTTDGQETVVTRRDDLNVNSTDYFQVRAVTSTDPSIAESVEIGYGDFAGMRIVRVKPGDMMDVIYKSQSQAISADDPSRKIWSQKNDLTLIQPISRLVNELAIAREAKFKRTFYYFDGTWAEQYGISDRSETWVMNGTAREELVSSGKTTAYDRTTGQTVVQITNHKVVVEGEDDIWRQLVWQEGFDFVGNSEVKYDGRFNAAGAFEPQNITFFNRGTVMGVNGNPRWEGVTYIYDQNIPTTAADYQANGILFKSSTVVDVDLTSGVVTDMTQNVLNGLVYQNVKDADDLPLSTYRGVLQGNTFVRIKEIANAYNSLAKYDIPGHVATKVLVYGPEDPYTRSDAIKLEEGLLQVDVTNSLIDLQWLEVKDGRGRVVQKYKGRFVDGTFVPSMVTILHYEGVAGAIDLANRSETFLVTEVGGTLGTKIDESTLLYSDGTAIADIQTADVRKLFNSIHLVQYSGTRTFEAKDGSLVSLDYVEVRNAQGHVVETHMGEMRDGKFNVLFKIYSFYETGREDGRKLYGPYDIATRTVATFITDSGREAVYSYSQNVDIDSTTHRIVNLVKEGFVFDRDAAGNRDYTFHNAFNAADNKYEFLRTHLETHKDIRLGSLTSVREEQTNGEGQIEVTLSGFTQINKATQFPVRGTAEIITFSEYMKGGDNRLSEGSRAFTFVNNQYEIGQYLSQNAPVIATSDNKRIVVDVDSNIPVILYDTDDQSRLTKLSIKGRSIDLRSGRVRAEYHTGQSFRSPYQIVHFDQRQLPVKTDIIIIPFGDKVKMLVENKELRQSYFERGISESGMTEAYKQHFIWFTGDVDEHMGEMIIYDRDVEDTGVIYTLSELTLGRQQADGTPRYVWPDMFDEVGKTIEKWKRI